jgi:hypothetical protein
MNQLAFASAPTDTTLTPRSAQSFLEAQKVSAQRIGFAVTQACPLQCAHCSVEAGPTLAKTTFTAEFGLRVAAQLPELYAMGIRFLDFTGGEPTLARRFVQIVSAAASRLGIACGIVTAAHWAHTPQAAQGFLRLFPHIQNWDISTDIYHLPYVSLPTVCNAYAAILDAGGSAQLRIAHHEPLSVPEARLIWDAYCVVGRHISFQPIGPVGRGKEVTVAAPVAAANRGTAPCPSTGLLIRSDGVGAPCCAPLSHEAPDSCLFMGNAFHDDLASMVTRWRLQPLLQTIRVWGFQPLSAWLAEAGLPATRHYRARVCDECTALLSDAGVVDSLNRRASELMHRIDLAIALKRDFNEPWMGQQLEAEARRYVAGEAHVWA